MVHGHKEDKVLKPICSPVFKSVALPMSEANEAKTISSKLLTQVFPRIPAASFRSVDKAVTKCEVIWF